MQGFISFLTRTVIGATAFLLVLQVKGGEAGYFNPVVPTSVQAETISSVNAPSVVDTYVDIFANNIYHVSQQRGSMLMPFVTAEGMTMNAKQINRIGSLGDPKLYTGRGSHVVATNPEQDTRWITAQRYWLACFVDKYDQIRNLFDIRNAYTTAMSMSFGRLYDRVIIAAALGNVWAGPNRSLKIGLPDSQRYCATDTTKTTGVGLNLNTLRVVRKRMKKSFAAEKGQQIVMVISAEESDSLLRESQLTNRDYTTILALMSGEITAFFGFVFVETQLLFHTSEDTFYTLATGKIVPKSTAMPSSSLVSGYGKVDSGKGIRCFAMMAGDAVCFGMNQALFSRVSERADLHYNIQLYYAAEFGAVRKEEVKVVEVVTLDSDA